MPTRADVARRLGPSIPNTRLRTQAAERTCGEGGIRTRGTLTGTHDFQSCTFGHSVTSPGARASQFRSFRGCNANLAPGGNESGGLRASAGWADGRRNTAPTPASQGTLFRLAPPIAGGIRSVRRGVEGPGLRSQPPIRAARRAPSDALDPSATDVVSIHRARGKNHGLPGERDGARSPRATASKSYALTKSSHFGRTSDTRSPNFRVRCPHDVFRDE